MFIQCYDEYAYDPCFNNNTHGIVKHGKLHALQQK